MNAHAIADRNIDGGCGGTAAMERDFNSARGEGGSKEIFEEKKQEGIEK